MRVAVVASNPSTAKTKDRKGRVRTHAKLWKWLDVVGIYDIVCFHNVCDHPTPSNRPLKVSEYELDRLSRQLTGYDAVLALGRTAQDALGRIEVGHHGMPHPSPRNRQLNSRLLEDLFLNGLYRYLEGIREGKQTEQDNKGRQAQAKQTP